MTAFFNAMLLKAPSVGATLLLDALGVSAKVAYSLRKLRAAYAGSAVKVRRSSDNTEQDIGFIGQDLDTASLLSFVGGGNGFITKYYDQSGNNIDAPQATAANQVSLVTSGVVNASGSNSKPVALPDGNQVYITASNLGITGNAAFTILTVCSQDGAGSSGGTAFCYGGFADLASCFFPYEGQNSNLLEYAYFHGCMKWISYPNNTVMAQQALTQPSGGDGTTNNVIYLNGVAGTVVGSSGSGTPNFTNSTARLMGGIAGMTGKFAEVLFFNSELSSGLITTAYTNQNAYYGL